MDDIKLLLDQEAQRINSVEFIKDDPVQFPRQFDNLRDIEIAALLSSSIAWGNRKMIVGNCRKMFSLMDWQPYNYVKDKGYEDLPDCNIHRTFFAANLKHYLRGLRLVYERYGTLADMALARGVGEADQPAWMLAQVLNGFLYEANDCEDNRCLPLNLGTTALKRLNMALRWLVRDDGIVDLGVWDVIKPSRLYIPLDVHVGNVSRELGLLNRRSNDRKAVLELTDKLRQYNSADPVLYDYALFGIGVHHRNVSHPCPGA